jgi:hypothetical protein
MTTLNIPTITAAPVGDQRASKAEDIATAFNALRAAYISYSNIGWSIVDSFEAGQTINIRNELLRWAATGQLFRWDGALPKVVAAASSPVSAGGVGVGAWVLVDLNSDNSRDKVSKKATTCFDFVSGVYRVYSNKNMIQQPLSDALINSRATTATANHPFGIVTYDTGESRIEYNPETSERMGLRCEEPRTNLVPYSEDFTQSTWLKRSGSKVVQNAALAPDGTMTMTRHENTDAVQNGSYIRRNGVFTTDNTTYCASMFVRRGSRSTSRIVMYANSSAGGIYIRLQYDHDLDSILLDQVGAISGGLAGREKYPDGVVRLWVSGNMQAGPNVTGVDFVPSVWAVPSAIGAEFGFIWGAQVEVGSRPTSYIPTKSSAVTRSADQIHCAIQPSSEMTLLIEFDDLSYNDFTVIGGIANTFSDTVYIGGTSWTVRINNVSAVSIPHGAVSGQRNCIALSCKAGAYVACRNGVQVGSSASATPPAPNMNLLKIGSAPWELVSSAANLVNAIIKRVEYYPRALTVAELQLLTL